MKNPTANSQPDDATRRFVLGTCFGLTAAFGYSAANTCLRAVSDHCDPMWVACVKAWPTALLIGPWLAWRYFQGKREFPGGRLLLVLICGALIGQAGNVAYQIALNEIGLALSTPLMMGTLILTGAILGALVLRERVSVGDRWAMFILVIAITVLSWGANVSTTRESVENTSLVTVGYGVMIACVSGACFGTLGIFIRYGVSGRTTVGVTTFTIAFVGIIVLAIACAQRVGINGLLATSSGDFWMMIQAGLWNALAFLTVTKALQLTSVVYVNTINGSQSAMCAVAGILLFSESFSMSVAIGIILTICALLVMQFSRVDSNKVT